MANVDVSQVVAEAYQSVYYINTTVNIPHTIYDKTGNTCIHQSCGTQETTDGPLSESRQHSLKYRAD